MDGSLLGLAGMVSGRLRLVRSARLVAGGLGRAASVRRLRVGLVGTLSGPARMVVTGGRLVPEVRAGMLGVPPGPVVAARAGRRFRGGLMRLVRTGSCGVSPPSRSGALALGARRWLGLLGVRRGLALMVSVGLRAAGGVGLALVLVRLRWERAVALSVL